MVEAEQDQPFLNEAEARVLASLMEKQLTTPKNYPLTMNALTLACNQKSSRDPVMDLPEGEVWRTVNQLADRDLVKIEYGDRANRVFHKMRGSLQLDEKQQAVLAVLMLRYPQTVNDIKTRTARMCQFEGSDEIQAILEDFMARDTPYAVCLAAGGGRREDRYTHLLCGEPPAELVSQLKSGSGGGGSRVDNLESRVAELESRLAALEERLKE